MGRIIKKAAFILSLILMTESVMANTDMSFIYSTDTDNTALFESIAGDEHSELAIETTTEEFIGEDEVESSAGVVLDLLSKIREFRMGMVKDGVVSDSAIDYEIEDKDLPKKIKGLLNEKYFELNETEKFFINQYLYVREDTMTICAEQGLDIEMSIPYALIMQVLRVDFEAAKAMVIVNESEKSAVEQAYGFGELFADYDFFTDEEIKSEFVDYALAGYTAEEVFNAYVFSLLINKTVSEVIYDKYSIVSERSAVLRKYEDVMDKYSVREEAAEEYLNSGYLLEDTDEEIEYIIKALKDNSVSLYSVDSGSNFDVEYDATFKEGALSYVNGINDSVDPSTGTLSYTENVCSLPGVNGLDFNLTLTYTSNSANTAKCIDSRVNIASNWRYNIPYITGKDGNIPESTPRYLTLADGTTFELINVNNYYVPKDCFDDDLKLYKDISAQGSVNSAFRLEYKNGDKQYFDNRGRWICTYNRFGNSIKSAAGSSSNEKLVIEDTAGRKIVISETVSGNTTTQTITMPDGGTTKFIYLRNKYESHTKNILDKKIDNLGNVTKFDYEISPEDNYKNALLAKITMPTGLENHYEYTWKDKIKFLSNGDYEFDEYDYPKIVKKYKTNDGKINDVYSYKYDGDYIFLPIHYGVGCQCMNLDEDYSCSCKIYFKDFWRCNNSNSLCDLPHNQDNCVNFYKDDYQYTTTVESEGGTSVKYYFDATSRNIKTEEMEGNSIVNRTDIEYLYSDVNCPLPKTITRYSYENNSIVSNFVEKYTYTSLNDISSQKIWQGSNLLSDIKYEYDYNSNSSKYYGICTKITTKMNSSTNIVQTNELLSRSTSLFNNMAISETTVTRNGTEESHTLYDYAYDSSYDFPDCRLMSKKYSASYSSNNSVKKISEVYSYDEGFANPTEISYQVSKGGTSLLQSYNEYCTYDANERIKSVRNAENYLTKYKYDGIGNITEIEYLKNKTDISGNIYDTSLGSDKISIAYNYKTNTITVTNENGKKTVYDYDSAGNKSSVTSKSDGTAGAKDIVLESYKYDTRLRPVEVIAGKAKTTYTYDNRDRVLTAKVTDKDAGALLSDESYSYVNNSTGLKITHTLKGDSTASSIVTVTQQDVLGRTLTEKTGNATTAYTYDMLNNIVKKAGANTETYEYNSNGNVIKTTATTGSSTITTTAAYDMLGNMLTSTDGKGNTTSYSYTGLNWLSTVETQFDSTGKTKTYYGYDKLGNRISEGVKVTSTANRTSSYEYDHRNRVVKSAMGSMITNNEYDGVGNVIKVSYGANKQNAVTYAYDRRNLLTRYTDAMGQAETYTYDDYGNMISKKDRNGNTIKYNYDALGRLLNEDTEGINNSFTYNMTGRVKTSVNSNVSQSYTYNNLGLVTNETTGNFSIARTYDTWGRNTRNVYKKGTAAYKTQKYTYDGLSRLLSVSSEGDNTTKFTANYTYDNNSNITKISDNNCTRTYTYNNADMLTVVNNDGSGSLDTRYSYVYNYDGNINKVTDTNGRIVRYEYNSSNQLSAERRNENGIDYYTSYYYNIFGNRIEAYSIEDGYDDYIIKYTYDKNNRLIKEKRENYNIDKDNEISDFVNYTITEYSYDNNGNQISRARYNQNINNEFTINIEDAVYTDDTGYDIFTYDRLNELTGYKNSKGTAAAYAYLPNHYRMSKTVDGVVTQQIWDGDNVVAEANSANAILRSYTRGHQLLTDDDRRAYMYDGHGNLVQQNRGTAAENVTRYDAYGNKIEKSGTANDTPFGYCGEYLDKESGLIYLRNRYYDSESGRFITEDPIKNGNNWYSYCGGNPVKYTDPLGLLVPEDGKYDSHIQQQLLQLSIDYNVARQNNDKKGMEAANKAAEQLRAKNIERVATDTDAMQFNLHLQAAFEAANTVGLKKDSYEYGLFITAYMINASAAIEEVNRKSEERFRAVALYSIIKAANTQCFTEETLVKTIEGCIPIKDLKVGDLVLSENEYTGEQGYKKVKQVFINSSDVLIHIRIDEIEIKATGNHPFYVADEGWVYAKDLKIGSRLKLSDGSVKSINSVRIENLDEAISVYNFEVEDWHTYFVSDFEILVHNDCWGNLNTLERHYRDHGADFNATSAEDYAKKANDFYKNRGEYQTKVDYKGVTRVYDPKTNTFGSYNPDGTTRTFFKPTRGMDYFNDQPGK